MCSTYHHPDRAEATASIVRRYNAAAAADNVCEMKAKSGLRWCIINDLTVLLCVTMKWIWIKKYMFLAIWIFWGKQNVHLNKVVCVKCAAIVLEMLWYLETIWHPCHWWGPLGEGQPEINISTKFLKNHHLEQEHTTRCSSSEAFWSICLCCQILKVMFCVNIIRNECHRCSHRQWTYGQVVIELSSL